MSYPIVTSNAYRIGVTFGAPIDVSLGGTILANVKSDSPASLFSDPNLRAQFARLYNGPDNFQDYADKIKAAIA